MKPALASRPPSSSRELAVGSQTRLRRQMSGFALDPVALCALLERVQDLPEAAPGVVTLSREGVPQGSIFVEPHAICWAAARGLGRRLVDLLAATDDGIDADKIESIFRACRDANRPLGEALVDEGVVSAEALRAALLRHTLESCALLADPSLDLDWAPRRVGYAARFTFAPADLLAAAAAAHDPDGAERAAVALDRVVPAGVRAFAFGRAAGARSRLPLVARDHVGLSPRALRGLGSWLHGVLDVATTLADGVRFYAAETAAGGVLVWEHDGAALVAFPPDRERLARAVVALTRAAGG